MGVGEIRNVLEGGGGGGFATIKGALKGFAPGHAAFLCLTAAFLGAADVLASSFSGLAFFIVVVTGGNIVEFVNGWGIRLGVREGVLALITRPPRRTLLSWSPNSLCSAEGSARLAFMAESWLVATVWRLREGVRFARAEIAYFHFTQTRYFALWLPKQI
jgi:hypothetical protein